MFSQSSGKAAFRDADAGTRSARMTAAKPLAAHSLARSATSPSLTSIAQRTPISRSATPSATLGVGRLWRSARTRRVSSSAPLAAFGSRRIRRPPAESPKLPVTATKSPDCAAERDMRGAFGSGAIPSSATVTKNVSDRTTSPPAIAPPNRSQASIIPPYMDFNPSAGISPRNPSVTSAKVGAQPIAAMSLWLDAIAFHPKSSQRIVSAAKCVPSTIVSVVETTVAAGYSQAAASSPIPRRTDTPRPRRRSTSAAFRAAMDSSSAAISSNSPKSLTSMMEAIIERMAFVG